MVNITVITLSPPTEFSIVSRYTPLFVHMTLPLGDVYLKHAIGEMTLLVIIPSKIYVIRVIRLVWILP